MRKVKLILSIVILVIGLIVKNLQPGLFELFVYWWALVLIVLIGSSLRLKSWSYLFAAFVLFFISALLTVIDLKEIAEMIMRLSYIGWLVGFTHSLMEYRKVKES